MFSPVLDPLSKRSDNPPHRRTRAALAWSSNMTAVTPETVSEQTAEPRPGGRAGLVRDVGFQVHGG